MTLWAALRRVSPLLLGLFGGAVGVVLVLLVWHLWVDHQLLHQMIGVMNQQLQKYPLK